MIRKLTEQDREAVLAFLYEEPEINLYIIGDVKNFGFNASEQSIYGEFREGEYFAVMSQNHSQLTYYAKANGFNLDWLAVFNQFDYLFISGKRSIMEELNKHLPHMRPDRLEFMKSTVFEKDLDVDDEGIEILENKKDAEDVYVLLNQIEELESVRMKSKEEFLHYLLDHRDDNGTTVFIRENNEVIASASAVGETRKTAMIVGVATHPDHRQRGLGYKVLHYLVDLYVNHKHKTLCLYYDDPRAGALYEKMGFVKIDDWIMLLKDDE